MYHVSGNYFVKDSFVKDPFLLFSLELHLIFFLIFFSSMGSPVASEQQYFERDGEEEESGKIESYFSDGNGWGRGGGGGARQQLELVEEGALERSLP